MADHNGAVLLKEHSCSEQTNESVSQMSHIRLTLDIVTNSINTFLPRSIKSCLRVCVSARPIARVYTYMFVYICICVRACIRVRMCVRVHACMGACVYGCMRACVHACMYAHDCSIPLMGPNGVLTLSTYIAANLPV